MDCSLVRFNLWLHEHGRTCRHISREKVFMPGIPGAYFVCQRPAGCANVRAQQKAPA